jgi:hypothetical protein
MSADRGPLKVDKLPQGTDADDIPRNAAGLLGDGEDAERMADAPGTQWRGASGVGRAASPRGVPNESAEVNVRGGRKADQS